MTRRLFARPAGLVCATLCALVVVAACGMSQSATASSDLVMSRCSSCHGTERICRMLGVKSEAEWKSTVRRMVANGARLKSGEQPTIVGYLAGLEAGAKPICK